MEKIELLVIIGPTASGKTKIAVQLAQMLNAEIISADSRQVYRGMDIGTGKDLLEYGAIPYHLIDIKEAGEKYNVALFQKDFSEAFRLIKAKGKLAILCGGTGLYVESVLADFKNTLVKPLEEKRKDLELFTHDELIQKFKNEHPDKNGYDLSTKKRTIRAFEITTNTLEINDLNSDKFNYLVFCLNPELEIRRERITRRLKTRIAEGLILEVENLLNTGISHETLQYYGLEYKYVSKYLLGELTLAEMQVKLETEIHRFAKRQMTFFRSMVKRGISIEFLPQNLNSDSQIKYIHEKIISGQLAFQKNNSIVKK